jgi:hypothetical protein
MEMSGINIVKQYKLEVQGENASWRQKFRSFLLIVFKATKQLKSQSISTDIRLFGAPIFRSWRKREKKGN